MIAKIDKSQIFFAVQKQDKMKFSGEKKLCVFTHLN